VSFIARLVVGIVLFTGACTQGPDFEPPAPPAPEDFRGPMPDGASVANTEWFDLYQDPVLRDLITRGLGNNRGVREAMARIQEARTGMTIANADRYPKVNAAGVGLYQEPFGTDSVTALDHLRGVVGASYEVDLWGRVSRTNEAALQGVLATEEAFRTVTIALVAEIANAYLALRDIDARVAVAEETVEANRSSVALMSSRAQGGLVPEVDVRRAEINLADSEALIVALGRARAQTENVISLLVGELPSAIERGLSLAEQPFPPAVPAGLPSELLLRRPDILGAERALHAQTARIGVAEAARFPSLSLTAGAGAKRTSLGPIVSGNLFYNLGANLIAPIFNSGALKAAADAERARTLQLLNQYEQTVLNAFREVEDALVAVDTYQLEQEARLRQLEASRLALSSIQSLYDGGLVSYQEVIDLQRGVFGSELRVSEALKQHHAAVVQLYRALGGGWTPPEGWQSVATAPADGAQ